MKKLVNSGITPNGGFNFLDPDTGFAYNLPYKSFEDLETHVIRHRSQNSLPRIEGFRVVWEAYVCANNPLMISKCCDVTEVVKRTFTQYWSGAKAYVKVVIAGVESFVSRDVANKRASLCITCSGNRKNIGHSHGQFYSNLFIRNQVGDRTTDHDDKLFTCTICTCILKGKTHYSDQVVAESLGDAEIGRMSREPRNIKTGKRIKCWQLESLEKVNEDS